MNKNVPVHLLKRRKVICLGDSITEGAGDQRGIGWPGRLALKLGEKQPLSYMVNNLGISGDHSANIYHRLNSEVIQRLPDLLIIGAGTNDMQEVVIRSGVAHGTTQSLNWSELCWQKILSAVKTHQIPALVWSLLPVDASKLPLRYDPEEYGYESYDYVNERITLYNDMLQRLCMSHNIPFLDLYSQWQGVNLAELMDDGLHPNVQGYDLMAEQIYEALQERKMLVV